MGLDVLVYDNDKRLVSELEIKEALHKEIFAVHKRWESYLYLRKLYDYYRTNEVFSGKELNGLVTDLTNYKPHLVGEYQKMIQSMLEVITDKKVHKIRINGD